MQRFLAAAVAAAVMAAPAAAARPDKLVVFGDSLTDTGNAYIGSAHATAQPGYGYFAGRFSNGPVWVDIVEKKLTGHYATPFLLGGDNFSVGGAQAAADRLLLGFVVPGLASQLGLYSLSGKAIDPKAVYVLNFGNNDVSALLAGLAAAPNPFAAAAFRAGYTAAFVGNYLGAITALNGAGATRFLIGGVPNPGNPEGVALEAALKLGLASLTLKPGTVLQEFDYFGFFTAMQADPVGFGLPADIDFDLNHACVDISKPQANPSPNCHHFFSFDGIHPTAPVHRALAEAVAAQLGIVPEPASWALMVAGFGLVGTAVRRRRQAMA